MKREQAQGQRQPVTLAEVQVGCDVEICEVEGSACELLRELGFCEQLQLRKLVGGRNMICSLCGTRMAISMELAEQVMVMPVR